jgi:hypothetical protein
MWKILHSRWTVVLQLECSVLQRTLPVSVWTVTKTTCYAMCSFLTVLILSITKWHSVVPLRQCTAASSSIMFYSVLDEMNFWNMKTGQICETDVICEVYIAWLYLDKILECIIPLHHKSCSEGAPIVCPLQKPSYRWSFVRDRIPDKLGR